MQLKLCKEEDTILEQTFPLIISFYTVIGRHVWSNKSNTMLACQIHYVAG